MSGIVGSRHNIRGSGLVGSLGTDGQVFTSSGAGAGAVFEDAGGGANTPAFYAHNTSATSCSASAHTKIVFDAEIFDSDGKYDASAGTFTPTVAARYYVAAQISLASAQDGANYECELYKNGSIYAEAEDWMYGGDYTTNLSSVVDLDADDYIEIFVYHNSAGGTKSTVTANQANFFSAFKIIE